MVHWEILLLPIFIVCIKILIKLFLDSTPDTPKVLRTIFETPTEVSFLALSFVAGHAILLHTIEQSTLWLTGLLFMVAFSVVLWKRTVKCFERGWEVISFLLLATNVASSFLVLIAVVFKFILQIL